MTGNTTGVSSGPAPLVSIVVLCCNKVGLTRACLRQLLETTPADLYELIIIDNASSDETHTYLMGLRQECSSPRIDVLTNDRNLGFVGGNNQAAVVARGKYLVLLNNDTRPRVGWLEALVRMPEQDPGVGVVGAKLVFPDGRLQEAGGIVFRDGSGCNYGKWQDPSLPEFNHVREVDYVSGACLLVRAELFRRLGGFDERYAPAYFEDTDLCFAVRKAGFKVVYQPEAVVEHHEGGTAGTDEFSGYKRFQAINRPKFTAKWAGELASHGLPACDRRSLSAEIDRYCGSAVLVACDIPLLHDHASGAMRIFDLLRLLRENGSHVTFVCRNGTLFEGLDPAPWLAGMRQMGVEVRLLDRMDSVLEHLRVILAQRTYAAAFLPFYYTAAAFIPVIRESSPETRIVIDSIAVHYLCRARQLAREGSPDLRLAYGSDKVRELSAYRAADAVVTVTGRDKVELEHYLDPAMVHVVPNYYRQESATPGFSERDGIVFAGNCNHPSAVDAVMYIHSFVWPLLTAELPDLRWHIVGDNPPPRIRALAGDRIIVTGQAEQAESFLRRARVSVASVRDGAGLRGGICRAMAQGLPTVTSRLGAEGRGLTDGVGIIIADDPAATAAAIFRLYRDQALWETVSCAGTAYIETRHSARAIFPALSTALGLREAPARGPTTPEVAAAEAVSQAFSLNQAGANDLAQAVLREALHAAPRDASLLLNLALMESYAGRHAEAVSRLEALRQDAGMRALLCAYYGLVLENAGQPRLAWESYALAHKLEPATAWIAKTAALFALRHGMQAEAAECLDQLRALHPDDQREITQIIRGQLESNQAEETGNGSSLRVVFGEGFHPPEGSWRWLGPEGRFTLLARAKGEIVCFDLSCGIAGQYAQFPFDVFVYCGDASVQSFTFSASAQTIRVRMELETIETEILIESAQSFISPSPIQGEDARRLALRLANLRVETAEDRAELQASAPPAEKPVSRPLVEARGYRFKGVAKDPAYAPALAGFAANPTVMLELNSRCNFHCHYCRSADSKRQKSFMSPELFRHLLPQLRDITSQPLRLHVDGEPTLHPQFTELALEANRAGHKIFLASNGSNLKSEFLPIDMNIVVNISCSPQELGLRSPMSFEKYVSRLEGYVRDWAAGESGQSLTMKIYTSGLERARPAEIGRKRQFATGLVHRLEMGSQGAWDGDEMHKRFAYRKTNGSSFELVLQPLAEGGLYPNLSSFAQPGAALPVGKGFCDSPWKVLAVLSDGAVCFCCVDITGETSYTRPEAIWSTSLRELWLEHPRIRGYRQELLAGNASLPICRKCLESCPNREQYLFSEIFPFCRDEQCVAGGV
jgi:GT2 family glycosyltransferase/tetratricopeptide (TPR) repeat protein